MNDAPLVQEGLKIMASDVEVQVLKQVVFKLDASLDKISEVSYSIGKLLAVHEERLDSLEKVADKRGDEVKDLYSRITVQNKEIVEKLDAMEDRIEARITASATTTTLQHERINIEMKAEIQKISARITILETWRWYIIGAAAVAGWLLSRYGDLTHLLK